MRKGLIRKAHLAHNLRKWSAKHPGGRLAAAVPETLVLELDDVEYIDEALADAYEVRTVTTGAGRGCSGITDMSGVSLVLLVGDRPAVHQHAECLLHARWPCAGHELCSARG